MSTEEADVLARVGDLIPLVLEELVPSRRQRNEVMGPVWQACVEQVQREPHAFTEAGNPRELKERVVALVGQALSTPADSSGGEWRGATLRSGCVGTFVDEQLRHLEPERQESNAADDASEPLTRHPLIVDALACAREDGNETLARNLGWMLERDEGVSYDAIAHSAGAPSASVRTGVRRARQVVRRIAHEKRRAVHAPHQGECPDELQAARDAWRGGDLNTMNRELDRARATLADHPYFLFLLGLWSDDTGDRERAIECFEKVLLLDDEPSLRAKVLNCLGYVADDAAERELARFYWSRSILVDPTHTPAHVNALKSACDRRDKLELHVCIDRIGELLTGRSLDEDDKRYLLTRLKEHPDFDWARNFEAWRRGPARWVARLEDRTRNETERVPARPAQHTRRAAVGAFGLLAVLGVLAAQLIQAPSPASPVSASDIGDPAFVIAGSGDRGGLSEDARRIT